MDWEDYRCFLALARHGSLSAAARALKLDHTTVGRRLASLETALKLRLVDRLPRAVVLTEEGRRLAALGTDVETAMFAVARAAGAAHPDIAGEVCISAPPTLVTTVLPQALAPLKTRHPALHFTLLGAIGAADLGRRQADIALRMSRPAQPGLVTRRVSPLPFGFYGAQDYDVPEADWQFIGFDAEHQELPQQVWLEGIRGVRPLVLRTNDALSQAALARMGLGVALLPRFIARFLPGLRLLDSVTPPPERELWLLVHDDLRRAPRIRATMDQLIEALPRLAGG